MPDMCLIGFPALPQRFQRTRLLSGRVGGGLPVGTRLPSAKSATMGGCTPLKLAPVKSAQISQLSHRATSGTCEKVCVEKRRCLDSVEATGSLFYSSISCMNSCMHGCNA